MMILDKKKISEILAAYNDLTNISTMYFDDLSRKKPDLFSGLDPVRLIDCFEAAEILKKIRKIHERFPSDSSRHFMTYATENNIIYNIHFLPDTTSFILTGPLVRTAIDPLIIGSLLRKNVHSVYQKQYLLQYIHDLPPADENHIALSGNMLEILLANETIPLQFQQEKKPPEPVWSPAALPASAALPDDDVSSRIMILRLYAHLLQLLKNHETFRIYEVSAQYTPLFLEIDSHASNHRMLKDFFLILIAMLGWNLLDRGANQFRVFHFLHQSVLAIEKELLFSDIIHSFCNVFLSLEKAKPEYSQLSLSVSIYTKRVLEFLELHYNEKITLKQLADMLQISPEYLSALLKKDTGMGIAKTINMIRIEKSKDMLLNSGKSILEIANDLGYKYQSHFTYVFKKQEAITPLEYKNRYHKPSS